MRSCIPLLKLAKDVRLFTAYRVREAVDTDQAAEYLSRHSIHATINLRTETGHYGVSTLIEAECASWNPDYMLMGAYGHGRLVETFGGVTKHFLAQANVPLILGH
jgi:nucleotide-binding universal stress UspA family protein